MKNVVVIGAGFCGFTVVEKLGKFSRDVSVTLIDKKETFDFLPVLPDIIGSRISAKNSAYSISLFAKKNKAVFLKEKVNSVDLAAKAVATDKQSLKYDYLVIASGAQTAYYGNNNAKQYGYSLYSVEDAIKIRDSLKERLRNHYVIVGGGYTGIEAATNIWRYLKKQGVQRKIIIVEKMENILSVFPEDLRKYCESNLSGLGIEIKANSEIKTLEQDRVILSSGEEFKDSMVLWVPGVKTEDFINSLEKEKNRQGRLKVDEYLRIDENCFVVGDAAQVFYKQEPLRMAVQFTFTQGANVAKNIIRSIRGEKLKPYNPVIDFGYVCPMANNRACGFVLGMKMYGFLPTFLHYFMCIFRMFGFKNKFGMLKDIILNPK